MRPHVFPAARSTRRSLVNVFSLPLGARGKKAALRRRLSMRRKAYASCSRPLNMSSRRSGLRTRSETAGERRRSPITAAYFFFGDGGGVLIVSTVVVLGR